MRQLRMGVTTLAALLLAAGWLVGQDKEKKESKKPEVEAKKEDGSGVKIKGFLPANFKKLGLSEDQKQQIYRIQGTYREKIAALDKQKAELKKQEKAEVAKVLTPAQQARLKEITSGEAK